MVDWFYLSKNSLLDDKFITNVRRNNLTILLTVDHLTSLFFMFIGKKYVKSVDFLTCNFILTFSVVRSCSTKYAKFLAQFKFVEWLEIVGPGVRCSDQEPRYDKMFRFLLKISVFCFDSFIAFIISDESTASFSTSLKSIP